MNPIDFTSGMATYFGDRLKNFGKKVPDLDHVANKTKHYQNSGNHSVHPNNVISLDMHAHPYVTSPEDLESTLYNMANNKLDILGWTTHGHGSAREHNMWKGIGRAKAHSDLELVKNERYATIYHKSSGKKVGKYVLIPVYEFPTQIDGVEGYTDMLAVMTTIDFKMNAGKAIPADDYVKAVKSSGGIVVAAHPFIKSTPDKILPFEMANSQEREIILDYMNENVDFADMVSSAALYAADMNWQLAETFGNGVATYGFKLIASSDTHGHTDRQRGELNRSNIMFEWPDFNTDFTSDDLSKKIKSLAKSGEFQTNLNYVPLNKWLTGVALQND